MTKLTFSMIFFASQCPPISNNSALPSRKSLKTIKRLYKLNIKKLDILKRIKNLHVNKAPYHRGIKFCINDQFVYASFMQCLFSTNNYLFR